MSRDLTLAGYAAIALGLVVLGLVSQRRESKLASLGGFVGRALSGRWRLPVLLGWMFLGWHFFAR